MTSSEPCAVGGQVPSAPSLSWRNGQDEQGLSARQAAHRMQRGAYLGADSFVMRFAPAPPKTPALYDAGAWPVEDPTNDLNLSWHTRRHQPYSIVEHAILLT